MGIYPRISTQQHPQSVSGSEAICGWDGRVGAALGGDTFLVVTLRALVIPGHSYWVWSLHGLTGVTWAFSRLKI